MEIEQALRLRLESGKVAKRNSIFVLASGPSTRSHHTKPQLACQEPPPAFLWVLVARKRSEVQVAGIEMEVRLTEATNRPLIDFDRELSLSEVSSFIGGTCSFSIVAIMTSKFS